MRVSALGIVLQAPGEGACHWVPSAYVTESKSMEVIMAVKWVRESSLEAWPFP